MLCSQYNQTIMEISCKNGSFRKHIYTYDSPYIHNTYLEVSNSSIIPKHKKHSILYIVGEYV